MGKNMNVMLVIMLGLLATASATELTSEMQKSLEFVQLQTEFVVDDVLEFLKSFETEITSQVNNIEQMVSAETEYINTVLQTFEVERVEKKGECTTKQEAVEVILKEYNKYTDLVNWITKRIQENYEKIEYYHNYSCQVTLDFVEYLRNSQNSLNLLKFLRQAVTNYSFTQMNALKKVVQSFSENKEYFTSSEGLQLMLTQLSMNVSDVDGSQYAAGETLNTVSDRSNEEIGTGHVDNEQGDLELDDFENGKRRGLFQIKKELLEILDKLEALIQKGVNDQIDSQIKLSESITEYVIALEKEIEYLEKELITQQEILKSIEIRVQEAQEIVSQCNSEYDQILQKIKETQEKHEKFISNKAEFRLILVDQLFQLKAIIKIYEEKVYSQTNDPIKGRYDDLLDNKQVDYSANVDDRELTTTYENTKSYSDLETIASYGVIPSEVDQADE